MPQEAIKQLLAACRSGAFNRVQQQVRRLSLSWRWRRRSDVAGGRPIHHLTSTHSTVTDSLNNRQQVTDLIAEGYPAQQVLLQLQSEALSAPTAPDAPGALGPKARAAVCELLADADKCLQDGADEFMQLLHVGAQVQRALLAA